MPTSISSSHVPYPNYPYNAVGATPTTKDLSSTCYDAQRPDVAKTYEFLTSEHKPSYKWPLIGLAVSTVAFLTLFGAACRGAAKPAAKALHSFGTTMKAIPSKIASWFKK